ncbi:hypothetical protein ILYODFUR_015071 [Ilyodon furcidens]|uniref:Uncharacterized protein n=1 Tax=Ilyodon furcidens TaxID=33524 RepID=A0ABV0TIT8_9TELE
MEYFYVVIFTKAPTDMLESCFSRGLRYSFQEKETSNKRLKQRRPNLADDAGEGFSIFLVSAPEMLLAVASVSFRLSKRLPGALSDTRLLCHLTRKEKKEVGVGRSELWRAKRGLTLDFPPSRLYFPPGMRDFQK